MITIQNQNFGVEIELTGITRQAAAQVIADYYGTICLGNSSRCNAGWVAPLSTQM